MMRSSVFRSALGRRGSGVLVLLAAVYCSNPLLADTVMPSERVRNSVVVREGPSTQSRAIGGLHSGDEAELVGDLPRWFKVRLDNGTEGFVSKAWTTVTAAEPTAGETTATSALAAVPAIGPESRAMNAHFIDVGQGAATSWSFRAAPC